jgi:hypothetical protein
MLKIENMAKQRALKELSTPNMNQQSLCIKSLNINVAVEIKSGLIHLLPVSLNLFFGRQCNDWFYYLSSGIITWNDLKKKSL